MRYVVCYRPGTVNVVAYVHLREGGAVPLSQPTVTHPAPEAAPRPEPEPEWVVPRGPGQEGTYHA
jgi:hypothetical protein